MPAKFQRVTLSTSQLLKKKKKSKGKERIKAKKNVQKDRKSKQYTATGTKINSQHNVTTYEKKDYYSFTKPSFE